MKYSLSIILILLLLLSGCSANPSLSSSNSEMPSANTSSEPVSSAASSKPQSVASSSSSSAESAHNYACNGSITLDGKTYAVEVVQTKAAEPDKEKFPLSAAIGKFDLIVRDENGSELHRQNLNALYHDEEIGLWGVGNKDDDKIYFLTSPEKDRCIFGIPVGHGKKADQQGEANIIFSLDKTGTLKVMPVKGGYAYSGSMKNSMDFGSNAAINRFEDLHGGEYVWDGNQYVLQNKK